MATVSKSATDPLAVAAWTPDAGGESKSERYLAKRLAAAAADFKGVALTTFLLAVGVGAMLWLAVGIVAEHWLVRGGLPVWARWSWLAVGLALLVAAAVRWVLPLVRYRVNLVYAARVLEQEHPDLHNDVVNAVLARAHADETTPLVVKSLRRRAAKQLSGMSGDGAIDRTPALRLAYALAVLVVAAGVYELAAPKSLVVSAARLVAPWLGVAAPSRVRIAAPALAWRMPGAAEVGDADHRAIALVNGTGTLIRGRQVVVASEVRGLAGEEQPTLVVTPIGEDGAAEGAAAAGWRVPMTMAAGGRFAAVLPDIDRGLEQSVDLVIVAGDAKTDRIRVAVVDAPALLVREVRYDYPDYTGQPDETLPWQGDLRAIEGTQVTVVAESNHPLETASIDLGSDGKRDVSMTVDPKDLARARGTFSLRLSADRSAPEHASYRLMFQSKAASLSRREPATIDKMEYRIEVIPDLAPEISIEEPAEKVVRVPPDAPVTIRVQAVDPDFGLASVSVETRLQPGSEKPGQELLVGRRKTFRGAATLIPSQLGVAVGGTLEYRAVAKDTRPDAPNIAVSNWQALKIDASAPPRPAPPPAADPHGQPGESRDGEMPPGEQGEAGGGQEGEARDQGGDSGEAGERQGDRGEPGGEGAPSGDGPSGGDSSSEQGSGPSEPQQGDQRGKSGESGRDDGEQAKSQRQSDPKQGGEQGEPQEGEQQGSAEGGKPQDGAEGKSGNQPGQRQQQGSQDGDGSEPQGQGGTQQQGSRPGNQQDGGAGGEKRGEKGGEQKPSGPGQQGGGREGQTKPGGARQGSDQRTGEREGQGGTGDKPSARGQQGTKEGKPAPKSTVASDGTDDGEAMERILEHRQQAEKEGGGEHAPKNPPSEVAPSDKGQPGDKPTESGKPSGEKPQSMSGEEKSAQKPAACSGADGEPCGKEGCASCRGGSKSGSGSSGQAASEGGEAEPGEGQPGEGKPGEGKPGEGKPGEGKPGEGKQGEGKQGEGKQGEGQQGEGKPGEGKPGEGKQGEGKQGEGKPGEGAAGDAASGQPQAGTAGQGSKPAGGGQQREQPAAGRDGEQAGGQPQARPGDEGQAAGNEEGGDQPGQPGDESSKQSEAEAAAGSPSGAGGQANGGTKPGVTAAGGDATRQDREMEWGEQDLAHARNAADLAIEHLRQAVESGDDGVLDDLGWSPQQARDFLARWEAMRRMARSGDQRQRGEFEQAVRSLGLRPAGVRSSREVPADVKGGQAEGRRSRPPSDYREQFKAFLQGAAAE